MTRIDDTIWCDGCGVEIVGRPLVITGKGKNKQEYCCEACSQGLECSCFGWAEQDEYGSRRKPMLVADYHEDTFLD